MWTARRHSSPTGIGSISGCSCIMYVISHLPRKAQASGGGAAQVCEGSAQVCERGTAQRGAAHMSQQQVVVSQISRLVNLRHGGSPVEATSARAAPSRRALLLLSTHPPHAHRPCLPPMRAWAWAQPADTRAARGVAVRKVQQAGRGACAHPRSAFIAGLKKEPTVARTPSRT